MWLKSVFFGKNRRISPMVFSTVPFSQLWKGAQKNVLAPIAAVTLSCSVFSEPLSSVTVLRSSGGYFFNCRIMAFIALLEVLRLNLVIRTKRVFLSVVTWSAARLCLDTTASPSQWPMTFLSSASFGLCSIGLREGIWLRQCLRLWPRGNLFRWDLARYGISWGWFS